MKNKQTNILFERVRERIGLRSPSTMSSSSKSRNFRRRGEVDDEKTDTNTDTNAKATPSTTRKPPPPQSTKPKPKKLLSFAEDEEDEQAVTRIPSSKSKPKPKPKPSYSSSHKLTVSQDRLPPTTSYLTTASNVQPQAGTYTKEALLELQRNTRTLAKSTKTTTPASKSEPKIILKGLLKPSLNPNPNYSSNNQQQEDADERLEDENEDKDNGADDAQNRLASMGLGKSASDDYSFFPDEDTIKKIRAKRERLRQSRTAAPDYISLDSGSNHQGGLSDEEPEFRTRIAMIGTMTKDSATHGGVFDATADEDEDDDDDRSIKAKALAMMGTHQHNVVVDNGNAASAAASSVVHDEEDEEDRIWEEEQFRKGLGKRMDDASVPNANRALANASAASSTIPMQPQQRPTPAYGSISSIGGAFGSSQGLDVLSFPQQADIAKKALQDNLRRLKESHGRTISLLSKTDENLSASLMNVTALEKSLSAAGEKFIFMQKLRDFVSVICEFLQHKATLIEELEERMQKLHEEQASLILERRTADNEDEMMEVEAAVKAAMTVFSARGSSAATVDAARSVAAAALVALKDQANLPVKLDEFGRDINLQKRMDMEKRAKARQRRKARFDSKRFLYMEVDSSDQKIEGELSTDESDSETNAAYQSTRDLLLRTAEEIFSDASEEYSQLSVVKERFETWKKEYFASYRDAYMSLSAPAIFSPYVRLELLKWDPLHEDTDFFDMKWHSLLFNYGLPEDGSDLNPDDVDANLVPGLVEKIAIPILHHEIAHCWDMLSTRETKNVISATSLVINYVSASSEALSELLSAIRTRLADAVASIVVPTWNLLVLKAVPSAAQVAAYRFGMSVRLMRNICLWKDILALPVLEKLVLDELLCGKVLPHVRSIASNVHDAVTRTERIIASLSGAWAGPSATSDHSHKVQPLVDFILSIGRTLEKRHESGVTETETSGLARRLKKMLVELNDYDNARDMARTFHLKEAL
ncbi:GC-RICH SEQUENCE DNA-BINDING FACTOR [Salix koriyanagi]|uniref:GC-RICH SEQUENCE DNA-BINDING FACTOR n=1 Tax=Salix koriyanagi TaxID=2511006 RepID=A0A9Q0WHU5_9ROSI|nr:GC-RICH SEQUENCE DNA-BINDING FACTOR [Salix koriyanagi]